MSELSAILTAEDKLEFASWLCAEYGARFVVDDDSPVITEISQLEALRPVLLQEFPPLIFVLSDQWSTLPVYKRPAMNQYKGEIHYVVQRYGGPAFTWMPGNCARKHQGLALSAGLFGDYPSYYIALGSNEAIQRPPQMASVNRAAQGWIRKLCRGRRTVYAASGKVGPWISCRCYELVKSGTGYLANDSLRIQLPHDA